ncbi:MAG: preprotein translocase subunit SecE [Candidatus Dadabacteria bacterium]|nr:preprotein translocase subunit SecE [Candidatus Dadabacteria bacterium]NIQ15736.1 preprotein translocase subunit SecE [Candidatus Dadabacteria bacterium]
MGKIEEIKSETSQFVKDVESEAKRITWPTKNDALKSTFAVILITGFFALFFALIDYLFSMLFGFILS